MTLFGPVPSHRKVHFGRVGVGFKSQYQFEDTHVPIIIVTTHFVRALQTRPLGFTLRVCSECCIICGSGGASGDLLFGNEIY